MLYSSESQWKLRGGLCQQSLKVEDKRWCTFVNFLNCKNEIRDDELLSIYYDRW